MAKPEAAPTSIKFPQWSGSISFPSEDWSEGMYRVDIQSKMQTLLLQSQWLINISHKHN